MLEGLKEKATKPIGPLPAFAWVIVIVGGYFAYKFIAGRSGSGGSSTTATTVGDSGIPATDTSATDTLTSQLKDLQDQIANLPKDGPGGIISWGATPPHIQVWNPGDPFPIKDPVSGDQPIGQVPIHLIEGGVDYGSNTARTVIGATPISGGSVPVSNYDPLSSFSQSIPTISLQNIPATTIPIPANPANVAGSAENLAAIATQNARAAADAASAQAAIDAAAQAVRERAVAQAASEAANRANAASYAAQVAAANLAAANAKAAAAAKAKAQATQQLVPISNQKRAM